MRALLRMLLVCSLTACGSAEPPAKAPEKVAEKPSAQKSKNKKKAEPPPFPQKCASRKGECLPPQDWVKKLCDGIYPDLALHLFGPDTPWKRLYMLARAEPFNASGGMSLMGDPMQPGEEVLALHRRNNDGEFRVGENAGYDVLRWNGACATIHDGDFTSSRPAQLKHAQIEWRRLELPVRQALEAEPSIGAVYERRHERCKGKVVGNITEDCEHFDQLLMDVIVYHVRSGAKLPMPSKFP
ncbi:MAG TPA: hypothetical protein VG937_08315 [Polyangiaceae bacterium]|nr:hypothetical protein [Polyangiaceae bacterium]